MTVQRTISPVDGHVYAERELASASQIEGALEHAVRAFGRWRAVPVRERAAILTRFCTAFEARRDAIATELSWQMGRPIRYAPNEVRGTLERARHMIEIAPEALADIDVGRKDGFTRFLRREPLGVVLTVAAWNYPYLIAVNSVVPAMMAGNAVVLKHSAQTPLCAERFAECFREAGLPDGVFQVLHMSHEDTDRADPRPARRLRRVHRLGGGRSRGAARRLRALHRHRARARRLRSGVRAPRRRTSRTRSRTSSTARTSTRGQIVLRHPAHLRARARLRRRSSRAAIELTRRYVLGNPLDAGDDARPGRAHRLPPTTIRQQIAASIGAGARPAFDERGFPARPGGHAVPRAAGAARRRSLDAGDARGDLRPGRGHHEGRIRRGRRSR